MNITNYTVKNNGLNLPHLTQEWLCNSTTAIYDCWIQILKTHTTGKGIFANTVHEIRSGVLCSLLSLATNKPARQIALCFVFRWSYLMWSTRNMKAGRREKRKQAEFLSKDTWTHFKMFRTRTSARLTRVRDIRLSHRLH
jgi:hypothetical protein